LIYYFADATERIGRKVKREKSQRAIAR